MHNIFYFTDIHGQWHLYRAIVDYCKNNDPECTIIFGGDACDRGPDGYKIMKDLLSDPQIVYLKGNHEDIFVRAAWFIMRDYKDFFTTERIKQYLNKCLFQDFYSYEVKLSMENGGKYLLTDWMLDGMSTDFVDNINKLPLTFSYENIDFCHAGGLFTVFQRAAENEYNQEFVDKNDIEMLLWDRNYLACGWEKNRICVHGHTPASYLPAAAYGRDKSLKSIHPCIWEELMGAKDKRPGYKIDMDTGATFSGRAYLLDVLTMNVIGFYDPAVTNSNKLHDIKIFEQYNITEQIKNKKA